MSTALDILPQHVAVIMDGNGRWAEQRGLARIEGHKAGAKSVRRLVEECRRRGVRYLTLYCFSTENWNRTENEVSGLMTLFKQYLASELASLLKNGVRLRAIGDLGRLPLAVRTALDHVVQKTKINNELDLILAISYGGREVIVNASKELARAVLAGELEIDKIKIEDFEKRLWTASIPDPDLLIRTSGELRISNFLLWQSAYTELVISEKYWPDFDELEFNRCLQEYSNRERRFGLTSEQIVPQKERLNVRTS